MLQSASQNAEIEKFAKFCCSNKQFAVFAVAELRRKRECKWVLVKVNTNTLAAGDKSFHLLLALTIKPEQPRGRT